MVISYDHPFRLKATPFSSSSSSSIYASPSPCPALLPFLPLPDPQMKRELTNGLAGGMPVGAKDKMIEDDDELLAALGYKVRSSDMADVALKMEQLEMAMGGPAAPDDGLVSHLASDTVHYNPSDLSAWLETMLSEINAPPPLPTPPARNNHRPLPTAECSTMTTVDLSKPLPAAPAARVSYAPEAQHGRYRKRMRSSSSSSSSSRGGTAAAEVAAGTEISSVMVVDSQENGIRLVHALMGCAEAVQQENLSAADALVKQISVLAASQGGAMRKVAAYFGEALARRIYRIRPQQDCSLDSAFSDILQMHFYESCPYLKFAHFTANQAILEAFAGCRRVHVIDFSMKQGMQWPALMQALALRPGGPPSFRLTGIGPPQPDNTDALQQVGWKLAQLADTIHVDFEYRGFVASSLADLEPYMIDARRNTDDELEAIAVNSIFELHRLLASPGALDKVLTTIRVIRPRIVTLVEQEANHNTGPFVDRFTEALHFYSTMFDSLESGASPAAVEGVEEQDQVMTEVYLGRQICNVVACEGAERTERHEMLPQWRGRMSRAGFEPVVIGLNAYKQASMLLALFAGGDGYRVEEREGCLTLGWHTRALIAASAWRVAGTGAAR